MPKPDAPPSPPQPPGGEPTHRCPECGGDVSFRHDNGPLAMPGARIRRWVFFAILLAVYLIALGLGAQWEHQVIALPPVSDRDLPEMQVFNGRPDAQSITLEEVQAALRGDAALLAESVGLLSQALAPWPIRDQTFEPLSIRLELHALDLKETKQVRYELLGLIAYVRTENEFINIYNRTLAERDRSSTFRSRTTWWPLLGYSVHTPTHKSSTRYALYYRRILALIILIVFVVRLVTMVLRHKEISRSQRRRSGAAIAMTLAVLATLAVIANINERTSTTSIPTTRDPAAIGRWFDVDLIRKKLKDTDSTPDLIRAMLPQNEHGENQPFAVVVGRQFEPFPTSVFLPQRTRSVRASLQLPLYGWIFGYSEKDYVKIRPDAYLEQLRDHNWWKSLLDDGVIKYKREEPRQQFEFKISVIPLILLAASVWILWRTASLGQIALLSFFQRKRVKRNQCIFCAYPLSAEALSARNAALRAPTSAPRLRE